MTTKPVKCYSEKLYLSKEIGICYHLVWRTLLSAIFILQRGPRDGPKMGHRFNEQWVINLSHRVEKFTCLIISSWFWMRSLIRSIGAAAVFEMTAAHPERAKFSAKLNFWAIFSNQSKNKSRYQSSPDRGDTTVQGSMNHSVLLGPGWTGWSDTKQGPFWSGNVWCLKMTKVLLYGTMKKGWISVFSREHMIN